MPSDAERRAESGPRVDGFREFMKTDVGFIVYISGVACAPAIALCRLKRLSTL
jgi:hypothetical protein